MNIGDNISTLIQPQTFAFDQKAKKGGSFVFGLNRVHTLHHYNFVGMPLGNVASFTSGIVLMAGRTPRDFLEKGKGKIVEDLPQPDSLYAKSEENKKEMAFGAPEPYSDKHFDGFSDPELAEKIPENLHTVLETPTFPNLNATYSPTITEQILARTALTKQGIAPVAPTYQYSDPVHVGENVEVFSETAQFVGEVAAVGAQVAIYGVVPPTPANIAAVSTAAVGFQRALKIKSHDLQDQVRYMKESVPAGVHAFQHPASLEEGFEIAGAKTSRDFLRHSFSFPLVGEESEPETLYARSKSSSSLSTLTEKDLDEEFRDMLQSANLSRAKAASDPTAFNRSDPLRVFEDIDRPKSDSAPAVLQVTHSTSTSESASNFTLSEEVLKTQLDSTTVLTNTKSFMAPSIAESLTKASNAEDILSNISIWMTQLWASAATIFLSVTLRNGLPALLRRFPQESAFAVKYPRLYARLQRACELANDQKRTGKLMLYISLYMAICLLFLTGNVLKLATIIKCAHALINQKDSNS